MKKIVIVGGGVAGLSAGIYGCKAGYEVEVYEKHSVVGGECTGWKRNGLMIDNCIHWLTGTKKGSGLYEMWREVGILGDDVEVIQPEEFYAVEIGGKRVTLWIDKEKAEKEFLAIAPEDKKEIKKFFKYVRLAEQMDMPIDVPYDLMGIKDVIKLTKMGISSMKVIKAYGKIDITQLCERFKNPLMKEIMGDYMTSELLSLALLFSYATITSGSGGIPKGGSVMMAMRMKKTLEKLGGKIYTGQSVEKVLLPEANAKSDLSAEGILLADGSMKKADYVILACDTEYTFGKLLDEKYQHKELTKAYENLQNYPLKSGFQVAFSIPADFTKVQGTLIFECNKIKVASQVTNRMSLRNYNYDENFIVEGKTVIQTNFEQNPADYDYWLDLYETDKEAYQNKKEEFALEIMGNVITKFPELRDNIEILDIWTPVTYHRYLNAYKGAYMSFFMTRGGKSLSLKENIDGLSNVFVASQWLMTPGGLPCAVVEGKFAVQRIMKKEGQNIREI